MVMTTAELSRACSLPNSIMQAYIINLFFLNQLYNQLNKYQLGTPVTLLPLVPQAQAVIRTV